MADNPNSFILDSFFPFHSSFFSRDNEALTKALQISISDTSSPSSSSISTSDYPIQFADPYPVTGPVLTRSVKGGINQTGRITKRKSRASKKSQTTYINADPANFREMVQQVTGVRIEPGLFHEPVVKQPQPQRRMVEMQQTCLLPTLDTSAHILEAVQSGLSGPGRVERQNGFGFESGFTFPTLESWGMIL